MSGKISDGVISRIPPPSKKSNIESSSLVDLSPKDKPWEIHRSESDQISLSYAGSEFQKYSDRIDDCAQILGFGLTPDADIGSYRLKLRMARFCHVRTCMVCSWRRSLMYKARAYKALPVVIANYPTMRYLFVTLTLKNCAIGDLKKTIIHLNKSFSRFARIKEFPAVGYIKTVEVTRGRSRDAHPHLHILMGVKASYFSTGYISKKDWCFFWKRSAKVDYTPIIDIQAINPKASPLGLLAEIVKYQTKPNDLIFADREWFLEYTKQIKGTKAFALGGIFKDYFKELDKEETTDEMIGNNETQESVDEGELFFNWRSTEKKYRMIDR